MMMNFIIPRIATAKSLIIIKIIMKVEKYETMITIVHMIIWDNRALTTMKIIINPINISYYHPFLLFFFPQEENNNNNIHNDKNHKEDNEGQYSEPNNIRWSSSSLLSPSTQTTATDTKSLDNNNIVLDSKRNKKEHYYDKNDTTLKFTTGPLVLSFVRCTQATAPSVSAYPVSQQDSSLPPVISLARPSLR